MELTKFKQVFSVLFYHFLSSIPILGRFFTVGIIYTIGNGNLIANKKNIYKLTIVSLKKLPLTILLVSFYFVLYILGLALTGVAVDPVLLRKYPQIFLYPSLLRTFLIKTFLGTLLYLFFLAISFIPYRKIISPSLLSVVMNPYALIVSLVCSIINSIPFLPQNWFLNSNGLFFCFLYLWRKKIFTENVS